MGETRRPAVPQSLVEAADGLLDGLLGDFARVEQDHEVDVGVGKEFAATVAADGHHGHTRLGRGLNQASRIERVDGLGAGGGWRVRRRRALRRRRRCRSRSKCGARRGTPAGGMASS